MRAYFRRWFPPNFYPWAVLAAISVPAVGPFAYPPAVWQACRRLDCPKPGEVAIPSALLGLTAWALGWVGCGLAEMFDLPFTRPRPKGDPASDYDDNLSNDRPPDK